MMDACLLNLSLLRPVAMPRALLQPPTPRLGSEYIQIDMTTSASLLAPAIMTAEEVFESVTNGGASDFSAVVKILNQNKPWCLIDGLAVNCYVEPVYTIDADIVLVADRLQQISKQLEEAGFDIERFEHSVNAKRG